MALGRAARAGTRAGADPLAAARADRSRCALRDVGRARHCRRPTPGPGSSSPCSCGSTTASSTTTTSASRSTAIEHPHMHGVLVLAIFGFCLVLAQFAAARRPLPAVLTVIAGAGWPATLYPFESIFYGAVILAAALWVLAGLRIGAPAAGPPRRGRARARGRRRLDLGRAREGRRARLGALGPERDVTTGFRQLRLGCELRRHRVPEAEDDRPPHLRAGARPLLARDNARSVHRRSLARGPDAAFDRPRDRASAERSAACRLVR